MISIITSFAALFRAPLVQICGGAVVLLALLCLADARGHARGAAAERFRWEARVAADQARAAKLADAQAVAGAAVGASVAARQAEVRILRQTLIREVPRYVTLEADARCAVPVGLVRLHDAAAAGLPVATDAAEQSADAASGLALSAVAETVADNYGACHANAEALKGWQSWWRAVSEVGTKAPGGGA
jgi:hypothetical protein